MNISHLATAHEAAQLVPTIHQVRDEFARAAFYLLIPAELFYFSLYFKVKGIERLYKVFTAPCVILFILAPAMTPIDCAPVKSMQYFTSTSLSPLTMLSQFVSWTSYG